MAISVDPNENLHCFLSIYFGLLGYKVKNTSCLLQH